MNKLHLRTLLPLLVFLLYSANAFGQDYSEVAGEWRGTIEITGQGLPVDFTFSYTDGELDGTIDIPQQSAFNIPVEFLRAVNDSLHFSFETGTGPAIFKGAWDVSKKEISGDFEQAGMNFPFRIKKQESGRSGLFETEENLTISTRAGQIGGSLLLTDEPSKLVILLNGSGAQDRDETVASFRVFRMLARHLNEAGYSSFRYDDRGVGGSTGETDATLIDLAEDLADVIDYLREHHGERFTEIILLGHSQGGMVASIAAGQQDVSGVIYMGTPFMPGDEIITQQIRVLSVAQGIEPEVMEQNLDFQKRIYDAIRGDGDWEELEKDLADRLEAQINELPEQQRAALGDMSSFVRSQVDRQLEGARTDWFRSFIDFDPSKYAGVLDGMPMLAVFGEKDTQVVTAENRAAAEKLKSERGIDLEIVSIPNANHLFQEANSGLPNEYGMLDRRFADTFVDAVLEWLNRQ